ncbi:MAG: UDP-3-O-[3-hydroxymyristoyl] N-acetylglucosamine deacetylase [Planctomycetia bacterium]|nr:UDP-3-O-[3-hydroxymyristoyl] N-acetylglucosamine deacetylase [Planctomycetia bacterium]
MPNRYQKTICGEVSLDGVGLHTGISSTLKIKPAKENSGLIFKRVDLKYNPTVPVDVNNVVATNRGTILERDGVCIHTVEHVLAALKGLGIDNAKIEISGPEPPIMDGSALPFVQKIKEVGITKQAAIQDVFKVIEPIHLSDSDNDIEINIVPADQFKITFFMDYNLPNFGLQYASIENVEIEFYRDIAPARTFGLLSEIVQLKQNGLIKGGNLENAVIIVDKKVDKKERNILSKLFGLNTQLVFKNGDILNSEGLRFENEPVRHKVLDLVGDLALLDKPIVGHVIAVRSGHRTNIELVKKIKEKIEI